MRIFAVLLSGLLCTTSAELVTDSVNMPLNGCLNFANGSIKMVKTTATKGNFANSFFPCTTTTSGLDFYANYIDATTCISPCPSAIIGTKLPFWRCLNLAACDRTKPFALDDVKLFKRIDTVHQFLNTSMECKLPAEMCQFGSYSYVVKTPSGFYVLLSMNSITVTDSYSVLENGKLVSKTTTALGGYNVVYWKQTTWNEPFFPVTSQTRGRANPQLKIVNNLPVEYYSITGKKLGAHLLRSPAYGVVIKKQNGRSWMEMVRF